MKTSSSGASPRILVIDDEPDLRTLYELTLLREGYQVDAAADLQQAWQQLDQHPYSIVITDMRLPDGMGLDLIKRLRERARVERCVVITAYGSAENAVESLKAGAFDYLTKPVDLRQFRAVIASAVQDAASARPSAVSRTPGAPAPAQQASPLLPAGEAALARLVGDSASMRLVKERVVKVARSMAPILISGESGTGKELVAGAIHANSHRATGPLVAVNCSAIPENLLESEFFGARKGSYTGASQDRPGFFQSACGGTLFLDEIGDLPLAMQSKLLRAIQERCVRPLGSPQEERVDVRILSATHKNLAQEVQAGRFRQDLFYRLNVIEIALPALRERREDLPALCAALMQRIAAESAMPPPPVSPALLLQLADAPLPGNVRELENLLHRALALSDGNELHIDLPTQSVQSFQSSQPAALMPTTHDPATRLPEDLQAHLDLQERQILVTALQKTGFNRTAAAAKLGLSLRQIRYRIARLQIDLPQGSEPADDAN